MTNGDLFNLPNSILPNSRNSDSSGKPTAESQVRWREDLERIARAQRGKRGEGIAKKIIFDRNKKSRTYALPFHIVEGDLLQKFLHICVRHVECIGNAFVNNFALNNIQSQTQI